MEYEFSGHPVNILVVSLKERLLPHFLLVDVSPVSEYGKIKEFFHVL